MLNYLKNLKIRSKLLLLVAIVLVGFVASQVSTFRVMQKYKVGGTIDKRITELRGHIRNLALLKADFNRLRLNIYKLISASDQGEMEKIRDKIRSLHHEVESRFQVLIARLILPEVKEPIMAAQRAYLEFSDTRDREIIPALFQGKKEKAKELALGIQTQRYESFDSESERAVGVLNEKAAQFEKEAQDAANKSLATSLFFSGFLFLVILAFGLAIVSWITKPLNLIQRVLLRLAEGDLKQDKIHVDSNDEVGSLAESFNQMLESMKDIVRNVLSNADQVAATSQQVSSSSQQMNATTQEVSATVQQISKGTEVQAQKVEETSKVMGQMKESVENVASSATQASQSAGRSKEIALREGEELKKAIEKLQKIYEVVTASSSAIQKLGERSAQIGEIVTVITDIADQTNLLALNAAIEAARAGEAGRGFAVVAEEVRKLAEGSSKQAEEIHKLIKAIQAETEIAVTSIQEGAKEATAGKEVAVKSGEALNEIISAATEVADLVTKITGAAQEQSAGVKQVAKAVEDIASSAEEAASATQQASSSTEEMTASMEELATTAQSLADMSMSLKNVVSQFQLGEQEMGPQIVPLKKPIQKAQRPIHLGPAVKNFPEKAQKKRA